MKAFFLSRQLREKLLLIVFVGIGAFIWLGRVTEQGRAWWDEFSRTGVEADIQLRWLGQADAVADRQKRAIANLDPAKSFNGARLQAQLSTLARNAGISGVDVSSVRSATGAQLAVHSVTLTLRNTEMSALVAFYRELGRHSPYISIEKCRIEAGRSNPAQITATFDLSSVELSASDTVAAVR